MLGCDRNWRTRAGPTPLNQHMKPVADYPTWYFVDEAGDPYFYGAGKKIIVGNGRLLAGPVSGLPFYKRAGKNQGPTLRGERCYSGQPRAPQPDSVREKDLLAFHAKNDCPEVRHMVYEALLKSDFSVQIVVARKREHTFRTLFGGSPDLFYDYLVRSLFRYRLHLHNPTSIIFSRRGNKSRQKSLRDAIERTASDFRKDYGCDNKNEIHVKTQMMHDDAVLQAADYVLWAVQRAYERREMRYFEFLRERIELVCDLYDWQKKKTGLPGRRNYYDRGKNPFHIDKTSPLS